jgi:hypothetical protein
LGLLTLFTLLAIWPENFRRTYYYFDKMKKISKAGRLMHTVFIVL